MFYFYTKKIVLNICTIVAIFLFSSQIVFAQSGSVSGKVTDAKNGDGIPGANIVVVGSSRGTASGADGSFELKLNPGNYKIRVSIVGYKSQTASVAVGDGIVSQEFSLSADLIGQQEVVILGSRAHERTIVDSPVPIDIIGAQEIQSSGFTQTTQILKMLIPSYNAPQPSISDGTDHVRPATLRGLGPDQVLILVNGKRRHTSALIHVNGTVGRGSTGVDLNAIPVSAIDRIEVLRDGAAAQYGSDAISGVINIILKEKTGLDFSVTEGQYLSTSDRGYDSTESNRIYSDSTRLYDEGGAAFKSANTYSGYRWDGGNGFAKESGIKYSDGKSLNVHLGYGFPIFGGNLYLSTSFIKKAEANRAGNDPRFQYSTSVPGNEKTFDGSPADLEGRVNHKYGESEFDDRSLFLNGTIPISEGINFYTFSGWSKREGLSAGFYRRANDARNVPYIYPNGFLPHIKTTIEDASVSGGLRGSTSGGWTYDLNGTYGKNILHYFVTNSVNASFGTSSKTSFDAGALKFNQGIATFDVSNALDVGLTNPVNTAIGFELRAENYQIAAGEYQSYALGQDATKAAGAQVFPGFSPSNRRDATRTNIAVYVDFENKLLEELLVSFASRFENYSDFGSTLTYKLASKYDIGYGLSARGSFSTGFRAPSLAQANFSAISTNFIGGVPYEIGTFPVDTKVAKLLGAKDLKAESSTDLSAGVTFNEENLSVTFDFYQINIDDRIVFTENFTGTNITTFLKSNGINAAGGRFFTNAVNTSTTGFDLTARYGIDLDDLGKAKVTFAMNNTKTEITNKSEITTPEQLKALTTTILFDRIEQGRFEIGQPQQTINLMLNHDIDDLSWLVRFVKYGEVTSFGSITDLSRDQTFSSKWVGDVEASYKLSNSYTVSVGSNNFLDVYPDKVYKILSTNGSLPYSGLSPWGFTGRYVYARFAVKM
ncbi:MAG: TonB-dependent receptor [Bacteroidota bacterium]